MANIENFDITKLTAEQLKNALALKEGRVTATGQKCSFTPKRSDQVPCVDAPEVQYGTLCYCKKHKRTVQAMKAKKEWDERRTQESTDISEPEVVPSGTASHPYTVPHAPQDADSRAPDQPADVLVVPETPPADVPENEENTTFIPVEKDQEELPATKPTPSSVGATASEEEEEKVPIKKTSAKKKASAPVVKKRTIGPNKWGRFEDLETGIIFDPRSKAAYGVQDRKSGKVLALTPKDIKICQKYKWRYHVIKSSSNIKKESSEEDEEEKESTDEEENDSSDETSASEGSDKLENEDEEIENEDEDEEIENEDDEDEDENGSSEDEDNSTEEEENSSSGDEEEDEEENEDEDENEEDEDEDSSSSSSIEVKKSSLKSSSSKLSSTKTVVARPGRKRNDDYE